MPHPLGNGHVVDAFEGQQTSGKEDKKLTSQPLQVGRKSAGAKRLFASDDLVLQNSNALDLNLDSVAC